MLQIITAKLKLELDSYQKERLREVSLAYRDALNYTSSVAFDMGKTSSSTKIQKAVYRTLRSQFKLPSQMACNVPRQVSNTYKTLWTKVRQNQKLYLAGKTKKRYKGLDQPPKFISRTCTLNYGRDYSFVKDNKVSVITLDGRIKVEYSGYWKHLEFIRSGTIKIGAAKIWYSKPTKTYYLLVTLELPIPALKPVDIKRIIGVDVGQRVLAVTTDLSNKTQFKSGRQVVHTSSRYHRARRTLQSQGTRSATRRLVSLAQRERRFKANINHHIAKQIVTPNTLIGLEDLTHIRERSTPKRKGKKASHKERARNSKQSRWAFAELHNFIQYKAILNNSLAVKIDAHYTSQCCPNCGHTSQDNRPNKGLTFRCCSCNHTLHSDLIGARNVALRTLLSWQDWESTGRFWAVPDVSSDEAKTDCLLRYSGLRWNLDTIPIYTQVRWGS